MASCLRHSFVSLVWPALLVASPRLGDSCVVIKLLQLVNHYWLTGGFSWEIGEVYVSFVLIFCATNFHIHASWYPGTMRPQVISSYEPLGYVQDWHLLCFLQGGCKISLYFKMIYWFVCHPVSTFLNDLIILYSCNLWATFLCFMNIPNTPERSCLSVYFDQGTVWKILMSS